MLLIGQESSASFPAIVPHAHVHRHHRFTTTFLQPTAYLYILHYHCAPAHAPSSILCLMTSNAQQEKYRGSE